MPIAVVVGAQWGDCGKGKVVDYYSKDADMVVRYQGGCNAGHTVVVDGKEFTFPVLPKEIIEIRNAGGLLAYTRNKLKGDKKP